MKRSRLSLTVRIAAQGVAAAFAFAAPALAQDAMTVDASRLTCGEIKQILRQEGAAVVYSPVPHAQWNLGYRLFGDGGDERLRDRYVAHRGYCFFNERIRARAVAARDTDRCYLHYCEDRLSRGQGH